MAALILPPPFASCGSLLLKVSQRQPSGQSNQASRRRRAGEACAARHAASPDARRSRLIVVQNRAEAAVLGEQRIAAVAEEVQVERLVGLLLTVAFDFD